MDPSEISDDEFDFDKGGIHLRLNRLIEKQTKRYENFIRNGNHGEAQQLLQIIWQLKQLRLPEVDQDTSKLADDFEAPLDQKLEPTKPQPQMPELEPWLMDELEEELHEPERTDIGPQSSSPAPLAAQLVTSAGIAKVHNKLSMLLSNALSPDPNTPPVQSMAPDMPDLLKLPPDSSNSNQTPPPVSIPETTQVPLPPPPPPGSNVPAPVSFNYESFDEISSGDFDVSKEENDDIASEIFGDEDIQEESDVAVEPVKPNLQFEHKQIESAELDELNDYDDPEDRGPLKGLMTTGHVQAVKKQDLDRSMAREKIVWEEEEELSSGQYKARQKPKMKTRLRERVKVKPAKNEDEEIDDEQEEDIKTIDEIMPAKKVFNINFKLVAGAVAAFVLFGVGIFAFNLLNAPNFDNLEKLGEQNNRPAAEMERLYTQAVKASPNDARGWSGLSYWQGQQEGKLMTSLESQAKAIKLAPKNAKNWYLLSLLLKTSSNYKESLRAANEAVILDPENELYSSLQTQLENKGK